MPTQSAAHSERVIHEIHVHVHPGGEDSLSEILKLVKQVHAGIGKILTNQEQEMADLTRLTTEVSETNGVVDSAIALLNQLADLIRQTAGNQAEAEALADSLDAKQAELAAAIASDTPA
jgi:hypothetical protein